MNIEPISRDLMRQMNRSLVLNTIRLDKLISRAQISRKTGLSAATISGLVSALLDEGLILEQEEGNSSGGRRPVLLSLNPSGGFVMGIKLMEEHLIAVMTNLEANVVDSKNVPFQGNTPEEVIRAISEGVELLLAKHDIPRSKLFGVGIGLAGIVDQETGILRLSPIFGWQGLPFGRMVQENLQVPVYIDNDVNTVTLTEKWFGVAQNIDHFLTVTVGRGIGLGIVSNGRLCRGQGGAGEFGHVVVDPDGERCSCGKRGCLETFVADPALLKQAKAEASLKDKVNSIDDLRVLAEEGNPQVRAIYARAGEILGRWMANLINIFDPQMVILTGEGVKARDLFVENMLEAVQAHKMPGIGLDTEIHIDELEDLVWARGAAGLVLRAVFESPIYKQAHEPQAKILVRVQS
ncbi:MAG: ROK family protein [Brevefilum sp.]